MCTLKIYNFVQQTFLVLGKGFSAPQRLSVGTNIRPVSGLKSEGGTKVVAMVTGQLNGDLQQKILFKGDKTLF